MANTPSAAKRARQTVTRTERNRSVSTLDRAVKTGQVHKNKANRHKSAISAAVAKLA